MTEAFDQERETCATGRRSRWARNPLPVRHPRCRTGPSPAPDRFPEELRTVRCRTMPDLRGRYTTSEQASYEPGPCPHDCGGRLSQQWTDARGENDTQDWWLPGRKSCPNPRCFSDSINRARRRAQYLPRPGLGAAYAIADPHERRLAVAGGWTLLVVCILFLYFSIVVSEGRLTQVVTAGGSVASVASLALLIASRIKHRIPIFASRALPVLWLLALGSWVFFIVLSSLAAASRSSLQTSFMPLDIAAALASVSTLAFSLAAYWWASMRHLWRMADQYPPDPNAPRFGWHNTP